MWTWTVELIIVPIWDACSGGTRCVSAVMRASLPHCFHRHAVFRDTLEQACVCLTCHQLLSPLYVFSSDRGKQLYSKIGISRDSTFANSLNTDMFDYWAFCENYYQFCASPMNIQGMARTDICSDMGTAWISPWKGCYIRVSYCGGFPKSMPILHPHNVKQLVSHPPDPPVK